jgi:hypothetical protein
MEMNTMTLPAGESPARIGASIGAVVIGILVNAVPATLVDAVLHALQVFPPWEQPIGNADAAIAVSYRLVLIVLGGYAVARFAPRRPMRHAWVLGVIGVALSLAGLFAMAAYGPLWYPVALVIAALPLTLAGAKWHLRGRSP